VALVIGNANYQYTAVLKNPSNDATDMSEKLRQLGFEVIDGIDLTKLEMWQRIRTFAGRVVGADVGLFFYAGHGVQAGGRNFLAPVDAKLESIVDLDFEAVELNLVLKQLERNSRISIVFLDACRDNPLASSLVASRSLASGRGLARVEKTVGMMIAYATQPGNVALDGEGRNSPFTTGLLQHMTTEGASINDVMIRVRRDVLKATDGKQIPWENSSLTGQFFFKPSAPKTAEELSAETAEQNTTLREEIARLQADQGARLKSQQEQLNILQQKLQSQIGKAAEASAGAGTAVPEISAADAGSHKTADLSPEDAVAGSLPASKEPESLVEIDQAALSRDIQTKLKELDCYGGRIDGDWGHGTRKGVEDFNRVANLNLNVEEAEQVTLDGLGAWKGQHCPTNVIVHQKPARTAPPASGKKRVQVKKAAPRKRRPAKQQHKSDSGDFSMDAIMQNRRPNLSQ
jgi:uncharacterized caspase-like protein